MKARIPLNNTIKREIRDEVKRHSINVQNKMANDITRRMFKTVLYTLNTEFGFGRQRMLKMIEKHTELMNTVKEDEVFWEHLDKVLIDEYDIPFERDYTNKGKAVCYDD